MKSTKKSLFLSILSLMLCVTMLVSTTFAWFTDSVTSGDNRIVAGNLDIEVSYKNTSDGAYTDLQGSTTVFSQGLWEPGHTEFVTLKVENKGTLACVYKAIVSPVSENGGINTSGNIFKLSDYLVFGTTDAAETEPSYTRDTARAAVGTTTGLNVDNLTKNGITLAPGGTNYITLVVYMPESVGNEANYMTGTQEPSITLGIQVYATQETAEKDSFDENYDAEAEAAYNAIYAPSYAYYPQIAVSAAKEATGDTTIIKQQDNITYAKAVVPSAAVADAVENLTLTVKPQTAQAATLSALTIETENPNRDIANFDVKIEGIKNNNTAEIPVEIYIGTGLSNVKAYHSGVEITGATYNAVTGIVSFKTTSFSDYTFVYDSQKFVNAAAAKIGSNAYATFAEAMEAAKENDTIHLLKDVADAAINKTISVTSDKGAAFSAVVAADKTLSISEGTFGAISFTGSTGTVTITGGTFSTDPTNYVGKGCQATKDKSTNVWTVSASFEKISNVLYYNGVAYTGKYDAEQKLYKNGVEYTTDEYLQLLLEKEVLTDGAATPGKGVLTAGNGNSVKVSNVGPNGEAAWLRIIKVNGNQIKVIAALRTDGVHFDCDEVDGCDGKVYWGNEDNGNSNTYANSSVDKACTGFYNMLQNGFKSAIVKDNIRCSTYNWYDTETAPEGVTYDFKTRIWEASWNYENYDYVSSVTLERYVYCLGLDEFMDFHNNQEDEYTWDDISAVWSFGKASWIRDNINKTYYTGSEEPVQGKTIYLSPAGQYATIAPDGVDGYNWLYPVFTLDLSVLAYNNYSIGS